MIVLYLLLNSAYATTFFYNEPVVYYDEFYGECRGQILDHYEDVYTSEIVYQVLSRCSTDKKHIKKVWVKKSQLKRRK